MKAKEYFDKYEAKAREGIDKKDQSVIDDVSMSLFLDFHSEIEEIQKKRGVKIVKGTVTAILELNDKWNALARLFEKKLGGNSVIKKDGFLEAEKTVTPKLDEAVEEYERIGK